MDLASLFKAKDLMRLCSEITDLRRTIVGKLSGHSSALDKSAKRDDLWRSRSCLRWEPDEMHSPLKKGLWASYRVDVSETEPSLSSKNLVSFCCKWRWTSGVVRRDSLRRQWHFLGIGVDRRRSNTMGAWFYQVIALISELSTYVRKGAETKKWSSLVYNLWGGE